MAPLRGSVVSILGSLSASVLVACSGGDGTSSGAGTSQGDDGGATAEGAPPGQDGGVTDGGATDGALHGEGGAPSAVTVASFMGINGFVDDPTDKLSAIGNVREYHEWAWCEGNGDAKYPGYPNNQNSFSLWGGFWDFDKYYADLKSKGVEAAPVIQGTVNWLDNGAAPPVAANASTVDPASYAPHADHLFQYAARYGSTPVQDALLKLAPGQTRKSGLGVLRYLEDWNEQDAWWVKPNGAPVFAPADYAAMASADYDGDQGRMGKTLGVKNADPNMKMMMGGLSGKYPDWATSVTSYLDGIRAWSAAHRGGEFPADGINVHHYSFGPNHAAVSPEDDGVESMMKQVVDYRNANLPGKEVWITEFGYDTDPTSPLHVPAIGSNPAPIVQGQWLARTFLAIFASGMDRAFMYILRDDCAAAPCSTQFSTAGITSPKGQWAPKPAYFFLATLRSRLGAFAWKGEKPSGNPEVRIVALQDPAGGKGAYVVWAPTSKATIVGGYALDVGPATAATRVALVDQQMNGSETALTPAGGKVTLDVSETPTVVLVDAMP